MKEKALFILLTVVTLFGCSHKNAFLKQSINYDTVELEKLNKNAQLNDTDSLDNVFIDDSEFCIKFKGGDKALVKYFADSFQLPANVKHDNIKGKVLATFIVNEKGEVGDVKIEKGLGEEIDKEVIKVVSEMPKWIWDCESKPTRPVKTKRFAPFTID
ncbi:energy transducer TonB [Pontibacter chinhatensis]|uniref:TonB protein C-terminal n=1 Tax=Pontibacter chinhatensis TaxID=1436961 RepID=A0A1I2ZLL4_9BACT|nr:energy transducer TonB [Pontibacter chinhatensis]SFH38011.1 TonB protein C-terminal [Pontibacter chinhatensis]